MFRNVKYLPGLSHQVRLISSDLNLNLKQCSKAFHITHFKMASRKILENDNLRTSEHPIVNIYTHFCIYPTHTVVLTLPFQISFTQTAFSKT